MKASKVFLGLLEASQQLQPKSLFKAVGLEVVGRRAYSLQKIGAGQLTLLPVTDSASQIHFKKPGSIRRADCVHQPSQGFQDGDS